MRRPVRKLGRLFWWLVAGPLIAFVFWLVVERLAGIEAGLMIGNFAAVTLGLGYALFVLVVWLVVLVKRGDGDGT